MISIDEGMQIDSRDEQDENAHAPSAETRQPFSNTTVEMVSQRQKHFSEMI
jgi:hypothetical protein